MTTNQLMLDHALVEQLDQKRTRHVKNVRRLLCREHLTDGDERHRIAAADMSQHDFGAPDRSRTCGLKIRSLVLYPAELRARLLSPNPNSL